MQKYRIRSTGDVFDESGIRNYFYNMSIPNFNSDTLIEIGVDTVIDEIPVHNKNTENISATGFIKVGNQWYVDYSITVKSENEVSEMLSSSKIAALAKINFDDNAIYEKAVGNKLSEYQQAEIDAVAFKAANYLTDPVPKSIKSWQDARWRLNWTAQDAADDIINQAIKWRVAAEVIRATRLKAKEDVKAALTVEELNTVMAQWDGFVAYISSQI